MKKALLLGAGFSYHFGMPLAKDLSEVFLGLFDEVNTPPFIEELSKQKPFSEGRPINKAALAEGVGVILKHKDAGTENYEAVLAELQEMTKAPRKAQTDRDSYHFLFGIFYEMIHTILFHYHVQSYGLMYQINQKWHAKLGALLSDEETWVFTLNHDLYMECLAIDFGIPITYGDTSKISFPLSNLHMNQQLDFTYSSRDQLSIDGSGFYKGERGINLVKLHGGLNELEYRDGSMICNPTLDVEVSGGLIDRLIRVDQMCYYANGVKVPSGRDRVITNPDGELDIAKKSMLTGGSKFTLTNNAKKGEEKLQLLDQVLDCSDELTIIGYGFGDEHVNFRISNAMVRNDSLSVQVVDPFPNEESKRLLKQFDYSSRVKRPQCNAAQWMQYVSCESWDTEQTNSLEENRSIRDVVRERVEAIVNPDKCKQSRK